MSDSDPEKSRKSEKDDPGESSETLDTENGITATKSKSGSVKFTEPLNDYKDLEDQYAEIMKSEHGAVPVPVLYHESVLEGGDIVETIPIQIEEVPPIIIPASIPVPDEKPLVISEQYSFASAAQESMTAYSTDMEESTINQPSEYEPSIFSSTTTAATNASNKPSITAGDVRDEIQAFATMKMPNKQKLQQEATDNGILDVNLPDLGGNDYDPFDAFEITPEDIFNEIKVAHAEAIENDGARNLHSYVISKSYSSENVVVLLNLRRLKDGEWVLDKTIAQGLKPETYGGIVSIDQYGVTETDDHLPTRTPSYAIHTTVNKIASPRNSSDNEQNNIMDVLRKMEEYVESVNKEISTARNLLKNIPPCQDPCDKNSFELSKKFDDLPFTEKMIKIFNMLVSDDCESCNLCNEDTTSNPSTSSQNPMSHWFQSLVEEISSVCGSQTLFMWPSGMKKGSSASIVLSQSRGLLEQVRQSLSLRISRNLSLTANKVGSNDSKPDSELVEHVAPYPSNAERISVDVGDIELQEIPGALELNIESKSDIEQILNEK